MPYVTFILRDGEKRVIETPNGENLMIIARRNGLDIEGACDGVMACSTCHLVVDPVWYGKLPSATADESDMLDLAPGLTRTSRLGCQIVMTDRLDGLIVKLPLSVRNREG